MTKHLISSADLTRAEVEDVLDLDLHAYRSVNPDLAGLGDNDLLHHYLVHGRAERRSTAVSAEQRHAAEPVVLDDDLVAELHALGEIEPAFPVDRLPSLQRTGPPADGSTTAQLQGAMKPGDAIAVTVEQAGGSPTGVPTSDPIIVIPTA